MTVKALDQAYGFQGLEAPGLARIISEYEEGLAMYARGEINYPCGARAATVKRWIAAARAELATRIVP